MPTFDRRHLQADLLRQVSRSFYLSMKALPRPMREPVSLGYLLARASDTIADTAAVPPALRRQCLEDFRKSIAALALDLGSLYSRLLRDFSEYQSQDSERELLQRLPEAFDWLGSADAENRQAIQDVLEEITAGQLWDLERFAAGAEAGVRFAHTATELETYTWRVAGCVGEFWTRIGYGTLGRRFADSVHRDDLTALGKELGQGLQLINILRDLGEDLRNGRCYLPQDELLVAGWTEGAWDTEANQAALMQVARAWLHRCRDLLGSGRRYVAMLKQGRVRYATALPLILAEKTADLLGKEGAGGGRRKVKISRGAVYRAMIEAAWA